MARMRLNTKLLVTYIAAGVIPVILVGTVSYVISARALQEEVNSKLAAYEKVVDQMIESRKEYVISVGRQVSANPEVVSAVPNGDTPFLQDFGRLVLDRAPMLNYITFAIPDGTIVARGHNANVGDKMADQENFRAAMDGTDAVCLEDGNLVKMALRGGFPLRDNGRIVGMVSMGMPMGSNDFADLVKAALDVECTIFSGDMRVATTIINNGERAVGTKMANQAVIDTVLRQGTVFHDQNVILGQPYDTSYWPIRDASGDVTGMMFIGIPRTVSMAAQSRLFWLTTIIVLVLSVVLAAASWSIARSITRPLTSAMKTLSGAAGQVAVASSQISEACAGLASSSTEQASSLEESSAALEQLTSQARGNSDTSREAGELMEQTRTAAHAASGAMEEMVVTMEGIRKSSDQVSGIIKTIEEIAFQTNLLALNAAVEAARAGDHGKGFAVVAEEVRNLAQRAGDAARNTAALIKNSVDQAGQGGKVVARASEGIRETLECTEKVAGLVKGVRTSSEEQSGGIEQINKAVAQMDEVTQQVAASSEEVASSAQELATQSGDMEGVVADIAGLVDIRLAEQLAQFSPSGGMGQGIGNDSALRLTHAPRA